MNRNRQKKQDGITNLRSGVKKVHQQAAGMLQIYVVQPMSILKMLIAAYEGRKYDSAVAEIAVTAIKEIDRASKTSEPPLCGACENLLVNGRYSLVIAIPSCDDPKDTIVFGICAQCATTDAEVRVKAADALRHIWPDLRQIEITHPNGGTA